MAKLGKVEKSMSVHEFSIFQNCQNCSIKGVNTSAISIFNINLFSFHCAVVVYGSMVVKYIFDHESEWLRGHSTYFSIIHVLELRCFIVLPM